MHNKQVVILSSIVGMTIMIAILSFLQIIEIKNNVDEEIYRTFSRSEQTTEHLIELKKQELINLGKNIISGPILRSSLGTRDKETIQDVLNQISTANNLQILQIINLNNEIEYKNNGTVGSSFLVQATVEIEWLQGYKLHVEKTISADSLATWEKIIGMSYGTKDTYNQEDYYSYKLKNYDQNLFLDKQDYREQFRKSRNRVLLTSMCMFLVGIIYSLALGKIAEKYISNQGYSNSDKKEWLKLLSEIEEIKNMRGEI